jgi:predicted CXXCH cytochrome family protein
MRCFVLTLGVSAIALVACAHGKKAEFLPVPDAEAAQVTNPHEYNGAPLCQRCHERGETGTVIEPVSLCAGCHDSSKMKHPWHVEQRGGAGPLPLVEGKVVCHSCHDPHDVKKYPHGLRAEYTALCLNCHKKH